MASSEGPSSRNSSFKSDPAIPAALLLALGLTVWLAVFIYDAGTDEQTAPYLRSRGEGQIDGITAVRQALQEVRTAVDNTSPEHDGLLAGPLEHVDIRYEPLGTVSSWTVLFQGPIRSRANTPEEFRIDRGMIVVEISAFTGEIAGHFAGGRAFGGPDSAAPNSLLRQLGISPVGFIEVPIQFVYP